jgi:hypothetical protein
VRDNVFAGSEVCDEDSPNSWDHNAFINCNISCPTNNSTILTNFSWQRGPLGNYYQPTNSVLLNAGSRNGANAGLYHFTTQTNQIKETNSIVDIGLHYVALDASDIPIDTDGDTIPDYIEDFNGNGVFDPGETYLMLNNFTDPGLSVFITAPKNNTIIP